MMEYTARLKSPDIKQNPKADAPSKASEPMEIKFSISNLSICFYDFISAGVNPVHNGNGDLSPSIGADNITILNFNVNTEISIKLSPSSFRVLAKKFDFALSLTPKNTKHLNGKYREENIIFPTKFTFDFNLFSESSRPEIKKISFKAIFFEEVK